MKSAKLPIVLLLACAALLVHDVSLAHGGDRYYGGGRPRVGVFIGGPLWPWYYPLPPSYYYYPPVVTVPVAPPQPPVYIERQSETPPAQSYWYYCNSSQAYYPYVQQCPEGWQRVTPQP